MANTKQAKKRIRQAEKHRQHNASLRSTLRSAIKKVSSAITSSNEQSALNAFNEATPILDRMAHKGIIHKNKAARHKSRLIARIKKMSGTTTQV